MANSILEVMSKSHIKLNEEFTELIENQNEDYLVVKRIFDRFLNDLKIHFYTEEQSIFSFFYPKDKEKFNVIPRIVSQHAEILKLMEKLGNSLDNLESFNFTELKDLLNEHIVLENTSLYAELDKELSEGEKEFILEKISK